MKPVLEVVRSTSIFFQPQIRTKILNEGWASYWHEILFLADDRINGHEVDFARVNAGVTAMPRVGLNPYALGMRLFYYIEDLANKGKLSFNFQKILDKNERETFNLNSNDGLSQIFKIRENFSDFMFINTFVDQDFVRENNLFVAGKRLNKQRMVYEYYVKSRKAEDYKQMIIDQLYHPPKIEIAEDKTRDNSLYLVHRFEGKPLVADYIANTMIGIEYLWGEAVHLETSEVVAVSSTPQQQFLIPGVPIPQPPPPHDDPQNKELKWQRVLYTMKNKRLSKKRI